MWHLVKLFTLAELRLYKKEKPDQIHTYNMNMAK